MARNQHFSSPSRFFSLDAIRGLAALAVVFNHWKHFFFVGTDGSPAADRSPSPLYALLSPFYEYGWLAVDLFFSLSGFIFFWLYSEKIFHKNITVAKFTMLRFSRLYPLHLITLFLVMLLQAIVFRLSGDFAVYPENNLYHFMLNFFFISGWGLEDGNSFNGPVWSVSIELILYFIFFIICLYSRLKGTFFLFFLIAFGLALQIFHPYLGRGIFSFFLGGLTYQLYRWHIAKTNLRMIYLPLLLFLVLFWAAALAAIKFNLPGEWFQNIGSTALGIHKGGFISNVYSKIPVIIITGFLFPFTILSLSLIETVKGKLLHKLAYLGDWSYSIYLIHFPLQLIIILVSTILDLNSNIFTSVISLIIFFIALLGISFLSFKFIERPIQNFIRIKYEKLTLPNWDPRNLLGKYFNKP